MIKASLFYEYGYNKINLLLTVPISHQIKDNSSLFYNKLVAPYLNFLLESREEITEFNEYIYYIQKKAEAEIEEGIINEPMDPLYTEIYEKLKIVFKDIQDPDELIDLCVDILYDPKSISSVKIWAKAKNKGYFDDPIDVFKTNYPELFTKCRQSPPPKPIADTVDKKVARFINDKISSIYNKYLCITTKT